LVKCDTLNKDDVIKGWEEASKSEGQARIDIVLFTVGV
jgi:hypothetical protein